jgi:DNA-directed RNA polymerase subunit RPC12/RpoP
MNEIKIYKLNCASCNSNLEISSDIEKFNCSYCGIQQIVEKKGGIIVLRQVVDAINKVQTGTDKTAAELALLRLKKEQDILYSKLAERNQAWKQYIFEQISPIDKKLEHRKTGQGGAGCLTFLASGYAFVSIIQWLGIFTKNPAANIPLQLVFIFVILVVSVFLTIIVFKWMEKIVGPVEIQKQELLQRLDSGKNQEINSINAEIHENLKSIERNQRTVNSE